MSQRHDEAFRGIRREHDDVVAALKLTAASSRRGAPGYPTFDSSRLASAITTAGDAYSLLLIASSEAFLRQYLDSIGVRLGADPRLATLIDRSAKEMNRRAGRLAIRPLDRQAMHSLRESRNAYAHGHEREVFPSISRVEATISRFLFPFP